MPMAKKHGRIVTNLEELLPMLFYSLITWSCEITWQTKTFYLHYHNAYDHKTWQNGDSPWAASTHKVTSPYNHVNKLIHISTTTMPMTTKLEPIVIYLARLLSINSHDYIITPSCETKWQTKIIIYPPPQCLWLTNWAERGYKMGSFLP